MSRGFLLDTNVVTDLSKGRTPGQLLAPPRPPPVLPAVVIGEFLGGLRHPAHARTRHARAWLKSFMLDVRVEPVTADTAVAYAALYLHRQRSGHPIPRNDSWIAAMAADLHLPLLTRDHRFEGLPGVEVASVDAS